MAQSLASAGTVEISRGGLLGRRTVYRLPDPAPREGLRQRLLSALHGHADPSPADRVLLAVLALLSLERKVLPQEDTGLTRREYRHRVTELLGEDPLSSYVARADMDLDDSGDDWWVFLILLFPTFIAILNMATLNR